MDAHLLHLRSPHHQGGCDKAACKFDHDLCLLWVGIIFEGKSAILKLIYCEKATKFEKKIFYLILKVTSNVKTMSDFLWSSQNI